MDKYLLTTVIIILMCLQHFMLDENINTLNENIIELDKKITTYSYVSNITASGGCEDNTCITYGGECDNPENSISVTDNGINLREECYNDESKIRYKYLGNGLWHIDKEKK